MLTLYKRAPKSQNHTYHIGDTVVIVSQYYRPSSLEIIDIDGHRNKDGQIEIRYLLSDGRLYTRGDLFRSMTEAKAAYTGKFEKLLGQFDKVAQLSTFATTITLYFC